MIKTFRSKPLADLWNDNRTRKIDLRFHSRILRLLDRLDQSSKPQDMDFAGTRFHALHGFKPPRYTVHVNGPWCITFELVGGNACNVAFEQYH